MSNISECLTRVQDLTQKNLEILDAINDLFFTKQNHISVDVAGNQYTLPSFLALENKINSLSANFENLVKSPESGEAFFSFDGNSRSIEVRPYTHTPNSITLHTVNEFGVNQNDIFKDFLTPSPFIKLNLNTLPNDITSVVVKKIVPLSNELKSYMGGILGGDNGSYTSLPVSYGEFLKTLSSYTVDTDYVEYDTVMKLPIRKNIGSATYVVKNIVDDIVDEDLDNYITFSIRTDLGQEYMNDLKYKLFDETIERKLKVGDRLVTYEGNAMLEVMELFNNTKTIKVKVLHGEFVNMVESNNSKNISSLSKIRFYSPIDFDDDKYIQVPLEEDRYVYVAVAALNDRMNVQSSWGTGIVIDTYSLTNGDSTFHNYYKKNVKNIGDTLYELTSLMASSLTKYNDEELESLTNMIPVINMDDFVVTQINTHLNNSPTIQTIRSLYSQKKDYQMQLDEVNAKISSLNETLATISFDDTTGMRTAYTSQISDLSAKKNELYSSITKILNEITIASNDSSIPIENAKYRIRGSFDYKSMTSEEVIGIEVQYRYKNSSGEVGKALSINDKVIYSDWNDLHMPIRYRELQSDRSYDYNDEMGPKFNQVDIPISQGELVEMKARIVYGSGWPFVKVVSKWSDVVTFTFPEEYSKNIEILDIIAENNDEIESYRFTNILKDEGIMDHTNDDVIDQDITYYHKPESISSGFYTEERRIIPLKDKLATMDASIIELYDEIKGTNTDSLQVSIKIGDSSNILEPYQNSYINVAPWDSLNNEGGSGAYVFENGSASVVANISIYNPTNHIAKLYSMFPGDRTTNINSLIHTKFPKSEYCKSATAGEESQTVDGGVFIVYNEVEQGDTGSAQSVQKMKVQTANQFITFRIEDINTGKSYYADGDQAKTNMNSLSPDYAIRTDKTITNESSAFLYPRVRDEFALSMSSNTVGDYITINPGEELVVPMVFDYRIEKSKSISKTASFDLRTSLYKEPKSYTFTLMAKQSSTSQDKAIASNRANYKGWQDTQTKYKPIIK